MLYITSICRFDKFVTILYRLHTTQYGLHEDLVYRVAQLQVNNDWYQWMGYLSPEKNDTKISNFG